MRKSALAERINRFVAASPATLAPGRAPVDERPGCAFGAITRQKTSDLAEVVGRIEAKVNAVLGGVLVAVILEIVRGWRQ